MTERLDDDIVVEPSSSGVGERLQQARQAKKYTVAEVASQLRLTRDIVTYLETQQWDKLHGRTYARGYFASYVKFLGLPFEEMLAVFNAEYSATEPSLDLMPHGSAQAEKSFPWLMVGIVIVVLLVVWLAYTQWQQSISSTATEHDAEAVIEPETEFDDSAEQPLQDSEAAALDQFVTTSVDSITEEQVNEAEYLEQNRIEVSNSNQIAVPVAETEAVTVEPSVSQEGTLKLSFSDECWVEVTDAESKVLVSKIMKANQSLVLESEQALNVLLGRASAVAVTFNNQQVDLTPHIQGDVARLTLGVES